MDVATALQFDQQEFAAKGRAIYERIKGELEPQHKGKIVAIEVDSGDYFLGETVIGATHKAREKYPDKIFYFIRVGYPVVYHHV